MSACLILWWAGCALDSPPPVAEASPASPAKELPLRFDCQNANVALGHPEAVIALCAEMAHLPGVFTVMLKTPSVTRTVVTDASGAIETRTGPEVAGEWLDRLDVANAAGLTMSEIVFALHALGGLPDRFVPDAMDTKSAEGGDSSLTTSPFRLVLVRQLPGPSLGPRGGGGVPGPPGFERAMLTRDPDGWRWRIEAHPETTWVPKGELTLGRS